MLRLPAFPLAALCLTALLQPALGQDGAELAAAFAAPPVSARPFVWWHWMNGHVSRAGITRDLEAMKAVGIGGVVVFEESDRIPPGPVRYFSAEHFALLAHAARECARLGLKFAFHNSPGWSSAGGPWVTPEMAMKHMTWSETAVATGEPGPIVLPRPPTAVRPYPELGPPGRYEPDSGYYRDVAVIAFPTPPDASWRIDDWQEKDGLRAGYRLQPSPRPAPAGAVIAPERVVDLTGRMAADGRLDWAPPPGRWTILRFGYTLTEHANREAPTTGGRGLEIDKLDRAAADFHWAHFAERILQAAGPGAYGVTMDSYEPLTQTWTREMPREFRRLRGYDLVRFLPCLTGRVLGSLDASERFLWDFRRTLADLVAENYYGRFAERCHERGLVFAIESYGYYGTWFDDFANDARVDIPMGEFWAGVIKWHHWSNKIAASAADIAGRHLVGAEAFTAGNNEAAWKWHPYTLKAQGDYFLCRGVNRFYLQASVEQPWADHIVPGMTFGPNGIQMNRNNTWWRQSRGWLETLTRSQYLLQQGALVADLYVDYGDGAPGTLRPGPAVSAKGPKGVQWGSGADVSPDLWLPLPSGRDFHVGDDRVVLTMTVGAGGVLQLPSGMAYRALLLPEGDRMEPEVLSQVARLVRDGATIVGRRPVASPSAAGGADVDARIRRLAAEVWGEPAGPAGARHAYGKGAVYAGGSLETILEAQGLARDFEFRGEGATQLDYIHRRLADAEFYFVSNQRNVADDADCVFRAAGAPELWDPETGSMGAAPLWHRAPDGRTVVRLHFQPAQSCFVVFRRRGLSSPPLQTFTRDGKSERENENTGLRWSGPSELRLRAFAPGTYAVGAPAETRRSATVAALPPAVPLSEGWTVSFPPHRGAPEAIVLPRLRSLTECAAAGVRYFSGTATYAREFECPAGAGAGGRRLDLDLGDVQVIAEVEVNGRDCGLLWKPPYRCDITAAVRPGANRLTVRVTNLWRNRLIGDARIAGAGNPPRDRLADGMLAGRTRVQAGAAARDVPDFPPVPEWVEQGQANPDPRLVTYTTFPFLTGETPLSPSGLIGPVRLLFGQDVVLSPGGHSLNAAPPP